MPSARQTVLGGVGGLGVAVAVASALGITVPGLTVAIGGVDATLATGALGVVLVGYALRQRRSRPASTRSTPLAQSRSVGEANDPSERFDRALLWAARDSTDSLTMEARDTVRERVRSTAAQAYARRQSVSEDEAADAVLSGEWTDDVVAAAFLGDERAPRYPLPERLRGWLHPDRAYRRRAERATDAVHRLATEGGR